MNINKTAENAKFIAKGAEVFPLRPLRFLALRLCGSCK